jgi:hypothetical protein
MDEVKYSSTTAYHTTPIVNGYLDIMQNIEIPKNPDDIVFVINSVYDLRPDLLAYDLYNHSELWWVFAKRNMNTLKDPLLDFRAGVAIYIPQLAVLQKMFGF